MKSQKSDSWDLTRADLQNERRKPDSWKLPGPTEGNKGNKIVTLVLTHSFYSASGRGIDAGRKKN